MSQWDNGARQWVNDEAFEFPKVEPRHVISVPGYQITSNFTLEIPMLDRGMSEAMILASETFPIPGLEVDPFEVFPAPGLPSMEFPGLPRVTEVMMEISNFTDTGMLRYLQEWHMACRSDFSHNTRDGYIIERDDEGRIVSKILLLGLWPKGIIFGQADRNTEKQRISVTLSFRDMFTLLDTES
jgi:hypothetical protein